MNGSASNDPTNVVLSLDDNQAASVDMDEGGSSRVDVDSDIPAHESESQEGITARKRVRFEE